MITLYTSARCPFAARVRLVLQEKAVPYSSVEIELSDRPQYMYEKNPTGTVPVLEDNSFVLPESRAIMEYLEERFPSPPLLPENPEDRARVRLALDQFERFSRAYYGWRYHSRPAEDFDAQLRQLNESLGRDEYVAGKRYTLADIGYLPWILRAQHRGVPIRRYASIIAWVERLSARPPVATEMETVERLPQTVSDTADLGLWRSS